MTHRPLIVALATAAATCALTSRAADEHGDLRTESHRPYTHVITLYDHDGEVISPEDFPPKPYSPIQTCGKCHAVESVARGWHFNANQTDAPHGRRGEPWLTVDPETGAVAAISYRGWNGTRAPADLGLSDWDMLMRFGRQSPGGGWADPSEETRSASDKALRWNVSGGYEIDCMACHSATSRYDPAEIARQIERENFRWIPTAAMGLAVIRGDAKHVPDDFDPYMPPDPDHPEESLPVVEYDASLFDADERVFFDITRRPPADRCYACHSSRRVVVDGGEWEYKPRRDVTQDVHLAAGLTCTDCHRNSITHDIARGYENEAQERDDWSRAAFSCRGCHLGVEDANDGALILGGHYGAPRPKHGGLPTVHLDNMTCTACHSGPLPHESTTPVQTSMAHALGVGSQTRRADDPPHLFEPVFADDESGKLAPQRLVWTRPSTDGAPTAYTWAIGHPVRPAAQSLGAGGCTDCHANDAFIEHGAVNGPAGGDSVLTMRELRGDVETSRDLLDFTFAFRPLFKAVGFACLGLVALVALRQTALGVEALGRRVANVDKRKQA